MSDAHPGVIVRQLLEAFQARGLDGLAGFYAPDYVNHTPLPGAPTTLAGHAAFQSWMAPHLEIVAFSPLEVVTDADKAAILTRTRFRVRRTGEEFDAFGFAMLRLREGRIVENWGGYDPVAVLRMREAGVALPAAG